MDYSQQPGPFVPVVTPRGFQREVDVVPLYGLGETSEEKVARLREEERLLLRREQAIEAAERARQAAVVGDDAEAARKRFLLFGAVGVALGAVVTGSMTAFALRSYRRTDSVLGPAIYAGLGSAAMGGAMIFVLSRSQVTGGRGVDPRVAALAIGARMAG